MTTRNETLHIETCLTFPIVIYMCNVPTYTIYRLIGEECVCLLRVYAQPLFAIGLTMTNDHVTKCAAAHQQQQPELKPNTKQLAYK